MCVCALDIDLKQCLKGLSDSAAVDRVLSEATHTVPENALKRATIVGIVHSVMNVRVALYLYSV